MCAIAGGDVPRVVRRWFKQQPDHHQCGWRKRYDCEPKCDIRADHAHAGPDHPRHDSCTEHDHTRWTN